MTNMENEFEVCFTASVRSRKGAQGNLYLNSNSAPLTLNMAKMAGLLTDVEKFMAEMKEKYGEAV